MPPSAHPSSGPRMRVISDNDYAGDPDGLVQLAHHALSPSVDLCGVISSHLAPGDPFDDSGWSAAHGASAAQQVLDLLGLGGSVPVVAGAETRWDGAGTAGPSEGVELILREAARTDTDLPLFLTLGGGLTELATAYQRQPSIAGGLTAVWIGGPEHPGSGATPPPGAAAVEYNLAIDVPAAQVVFGSPVPLWQVPRNSYRQALVSMTELVVRMRPHGEIGRHLYDSLAAVQLRAARHGHDLGETYVLGDNPLVLLTALQSSFEPDPSSSDHTVMRRPRIDDAGRYEDDPDGAAMRVYGGLDCRLMFEDLFAKLALAS